MSTSIWENTENPKLAKKKQKHCPGPGWVISDRTFHLKCNTKCLVQCSGCGKTRTVLESTRDAWNFSDLCISCKRLEVKTVREEKARLFPQKRCLKCDELFQPTPLRRFLCEHCLEMNMNPRVSCGVREGFEYA